MADRQILMGVVGRPHGVRGLVHVHSYTADPAGLAKYSPLHDGTGRAFVLRWASPGVAELSLLVDGKKVALADRTAAEKLVNVRLYVDRARLPKTRPDEFYLSDLVGMEAFGPDGSSLGHVGAVHDYGAGASLEIGAMLVPFTRAAVPDVDVEARTLRVIPPDEVIVEGQAA